MKIFIKNMACESCKIVVKETLEEMGLHPVMVELGEAEVAEKVSAEQKRKLNSELKKAGLAVIESKEGIILEKIKKEIIDFINKNPKDRPKNFSKYLSEKLDYSYSFLANLFTTLNASTIEQYMINLKIERVKELLLFKDLTLTQIAEKLNYSSVAHLSGQFKKITGLTVSHFKKLKENRRIVIQNL